MKSLHKVFLVLSALLAFSISSFAGAVDYYPAMMTEKTEYGWRVVLTNNAFQKGLDKEAVLTIETAKELALWYKEHREELKGKTAFFKTFFNCKIDFRMLSRRRAANIMKMFAENNIAYVGKAIHTRCPSWTWLIDVDNPSNVVNRTVRIEFR